MSTVLRTLRNLRKAGLRDAAHQMQVIRLWRYKWNLELGLIWIAGDTKAGTLIAIDRYGNKYFENFSDELPLRTRWVDYKDYELDP
ncbi:hypothetical protein ACEPPN_012796 [Leptodophora sp. 'Broadleaf-Isolate-01']